MITMKHEEMIKCLDEIAGKTQDARADGIAAWLRMSLERDHKPTMALVSFNLNHTERFHMLRQFLGVEIPGEIAAMFEGEPACLILDYHDTPALLKEPEGMGHKREYGIPAEILKKYRIAICDAIQSGDEWRELSDEIDVACLVVNAMMAMNQMERTWLGDSARGLFGAEELLLLITKMEQLNDEEDVQAVRGAVEDALKRLGLSPEIYEEERAALDEMSRFLCGSSVQERHDRRVVRNGLDAMRKQMEYLIDSVVTDTAAIESAMEQLKRQQKKLELAGQMASESILSNALNRLKVQLSEGIRDYGRQMAESIKRKVEASPLDQLETMDDRINGYISGSWEHYMKSMSAKMDKEMEAIAGKLTRQMETDAGLLIADLDESARRTVYSALGLGYDAMEIGKENWADSPSMLHSKGVLTEVSVGMVTDRLRRETRNMMLLSIPLLFVNPLVSVGNIVVARAYGKMRADRELKDIRTEMAEQIERMCFDQTEQMVRQTELAFDDEIRTGSLKIKSAYHDLIQQVGDRLTELQDSQEEQLALKEYLSNQIRVVFPGFMSEPD